MNRTLVLSFALALALVTFSASAQEGRAQAMSPFDAVEWSETDNPRPRVLIGDTWYLLDAVNGMPINDLLAGIEQHYNRRDLQKRFEEDLVEALGKLGVAKGQSATLLVRTAEDQPAQTITAEWSREKRNALRNARRDSTDRERPRNADTDAAAVTRTLDALEQLILKRSAYTAASPLPLESQPWHQKLTAARARTAEIKTSADLTLEVVRVVAAIGDAHARVSGPRDPRLRARLPFLILPLHHSAGPVLAVQPDHSDFLRTDTPVLTSIDGVSIDRWLAAAAELVPAASPQLIRDRSCRLLNQLEFLRAIVSPASLGDPRVRVGLASLDGTRSHDMTLALTDLPPDPAPWPEGGSNRITASDGKSVGYLRLAQMDDAAANAVRQWFAKAQSINRLIIDVRGNGGGSRDALFALAEAILPADAEPAVINAARPLLVDGAVPEQVARNLNRRGLRPENDPAWSDAERAAIAAFKHQFTPALKLADDRFDNWWFACVSPDKDGDTRWRGRVVVLQDAGCFSATDVFLAAIKALPNVMLVGEPSGGGSGSAIEHDLPGGLHVRLSSMVSFQPTGELFDGIGVEPDVEIEREPNDVLMLQNRWVRFAAEIAAQGQPD